MGLCPSKPEEGGGGGGGGGGGAHVVEDATEVSEREVVKRYRKGDQIGTGNFAEVFKATRLLDGPGDLSRGLEVAMKYIDKSNEECVPPACARARARRWAHPSPFAAWTPRSSPRRRGL